MEMKNFLSYFQPYLRNVEKEKNVKIFVSFGNNNVMMYYYQNSKRKIYGFLDYEKNYYKNRRSLRKW